MIKNYFSLAFENLKHRGLRSWLTMFGIFIGIAAVVSLISLGQGLQEAVTGQFSRLDPDKLVVSNVETGFGPPGSTVVEKLDSHDLRVVEGTRGVDIAVPRLIRVGKIDPYNDGKALVFTYISDIPENEEEIQIIYDSLNLELESGKLLTGSDRGKVVLGHDFISKPESEGKSIKVGDIMKIQDKDFEVSGLLKKTGTFQINSIVIMSNEDLTDIFNIEDEIDIILVQVEDLDMIEETSENLERALRRDRNLKLGEEDFSVQTPLESLDAINTVLNIINLIVVGIAIISLIVGGSGIANTMFTSVLERKKEIGTMKAVGAKNKDILFLFLFESGLLGLVGGVVGAVMGLGLAMVASSGANAALGSDLFIVNPSIPLLIASVSFSFLIGIISGTLPALQASKLKPVDALRG